MDVGREARLGPPPSLMSPVSLGGVLSAVPFCLVRTGVLRSGNAEIDAGGHASPQSSCKSNIPRQPSCSSPHSYHVIIVVLLSASSSRSSRVHSSHSSVVDPSNLKDLHHSINKDIDIVVNEHSLLHRATLAHNANEGERTVTRRQPCTSHSNHAITKLTHSPLSQTCNRLPFCRT